MGWVLFTSDPGMLRFLFRCLDISVEPVDVGYILASRLRRGAEHRCMNTLCRLERHLHPAFSVRVARWRWVILRSVVFCCSFRAKCVCC